MCIRDSLRGVFCKAIFEWRKHSSLSILWNNISCNIKSYYIAYANKKIEELDTRRQTISKAIAELSVETISPQQIKKLSYYLDNWDSIDFDDKRKAADGLISTIKATSDRVQIEWKIWHFRSIAPHFYFISFVPVSYTHLEKPMDACTKDFRKIDK